MAGAEIANLKANWINGALRIQDVATGNDVLVIGATTGAPYGYQNQGTATITTATTLTPSTHGGKLLLCPTDGTVISLTDGASSTAYGAQYTITNTASDGGALVVVAGAGTASSYWILGAGTANATTNTFIANTKTTQQYGDSVTLQFNGSTAWMVTNLVGTWAISATS